MSPTRDAQSARDSKSNLGRRRRAAQTDGSDDYAARKQELLQVRGPGLSGQGLRENHHY